jgi:hypothetical protein
MPLSEGKAQVTAAKDCNSNAFNVITEATLLDCKE